MVPASPPSGACPECGVPCASIAAHREAAHTRHPTHECPACGFLFWTAQKLDDHAAMLHAAPRPCCNICHSSFHAKDDLSAHLRATHRDSQMIFCALCAEPCVGPDAVRAHMDAEHPDDWLACDACGAGSGVYFESAEFLDAHKLHAHVDASLVCDVCGAVSESKDAKRWHRSREHPTAFPLRCEACSMRFRAPENLTLHQRLEHGAVGNGAGGGAAGNRPPKAERVDDPHACPACPRKFGTSGAAARHFLERHARKACDLCGEVFGASGWLRHHERYCILKLRISCPFHLPEYVGCGL
jgi:hypothetical protein